MNFSTKFRVIRNVKSELGLTSARLGQTVSTDLALMPGTKSTSFDLSNNSSLSCRSFCCDVTSEFLLLTGHLCPTGPLNLSASAFVHFPA